MKLIISKFITETNHYCFYRYGLYRIVRADSMILTFHVPLLARWLGVPTWDYVISIVYKLALVQKNSDFSIVSLLGIVHTGKSSNDLFQL